MAKKKVRQLVFETVYLVLALFGLLNSLGYFSADFNEEFYVYYTNLSNYICMGIMVAAWINTYKQLTGKKVKRNTAAPVFTFLGVIMILVTFLVYNILLANENTVVEYFTSQSNMILHVILPVMFVVHWFVFCEHPTLRVYHPLLSVVMPLIYVAFIVIRAAVIPADVDTVRYPYFFLDIPTLGVGGFLTWIAVLLVIFIAIGYVLYALDLKVLSRKKEKVAK